MGVLSFVSNMFGWSENHIPQKTTITSTEDYMVAWRKYFTSTEDYMVAWRKYFTSFSFLRKRKYKGFHWRRAIK